jgi:hypothetical protein
MRSPVGRLCRNLAFLLAICFALPASAQDRPRAPTASGAVILPSNSRSLTGKERLGRKWMDEQRIDNCNVPTDRRGMKPRPSACHNAPTG